MNSVKDIGVLTLHRAHNYGAVLQCYALKLVCESLGHQVETIDYNPFGKYKVSWVFNYRHPVTAYKYLANLFRFENFVKHRLNPTTTIESHDMIKANPPQDDIYIVGSDQVWANAIAGDYFDSYLLDFAPKNVKRVAYAASTGGNPMELNDYQLAELRKFSAISVREKQSVSDVQSKVDIPVTDVCDPTILLNKDEYEKLEKKPFMLPKHYMVYFDLAGDSFCAEAVKRLSKQLNLPILNLAGKYKRWARYNRLAPTPEEWLYIMHHADYICTNSFHGAAFSIVLQKPFLYSAPQIGGRAKNNGRVLNLLEHTHFTNRYITDVNQITHELISNMSDIEANSKYVDEYRNRSILWLKNALEDETD